MHITKKVGMSETVNSPHFMGITCNSRQPPDCQAPP